MKDAPKNQEEILSKLGIDNLNPMQEEAFSTIQAQQEVVLLSPTGTGKTLAFLLPVLTQLNPDNNEVQVLILTPSRELAIQIEQVIREMGTGYKANAVYGGRPFSKDKIDLKHPPAILIGTPGRVADHLRRGTFSTEFIQTLVLDEYDKSLEVGFEEEMKEIIGALPMAKKKILTSATQQNSIPSFVKLKNPAILNYNQGGTSQLTLKTVISPDKDKLDTLVQLLSHIGNHPGIVFCNFKESIERVSEFLVDHNIVHGIFQGGMEQIDRERALIKFRNGTHQLLIATDLAARGIDIPELKFIIHYHLPLKSHEFTHRNGRTARMNSDGTAYILKWKNERLPDFIKDAEVMELTKAPIPSPTGWKTLYVTGGRRDKISKGDIAGLFFKQGKLKPEQLGLIELKQDCAFVAVPTDAVKNLLPLVNDYKLKTKKVRVSVIR